MKTTTRAIVVIGSMLIASASLWLAVSEAHATRASLDAIKAERNRHTRVVQDLARQTARSAEREGQLTETTKKTADNSALPSATPRARSAPPPAQDFSLSAGKPSLADPKTRAVFAQARPAELEFAYGPFVAMTGLDADQAKKFIAAVLAHEKAMFDLRAMKASPKADVEAIERYERNVLEQHYTAQRALLGEEAFRILPDYDRTRAARTWVMDFAGMVALAADALTLEQGERLTRALANGSQSYRDGGAVDPAAIDWESADEEASRILSPAQFTLYRWADPSVATSRASRATQRLRRLVESIP